MVRKVIQSVLTVIILLVVSAATPAPIYAELSDTPDGGYYTVSSQDRTFYFLFSQVYGTGQTTLDYEIFQNHDSTPISGQVNVSPGVNKVSIALPIGTYPGNKYYLFTLTTTKGRKLYKHFYIP